MPSKIVPRFSGLPALVALCFCLLFLSTQASSEDAAAPSAAAPTPAYPTPPPVVIPEKLLLNTMSKLYGPVNFSHRSHTEYAEKGCIACHHHGASDPSLTCRSCHLDPAFPYKNQSGRNATCLLCHYPRSVIEKSSWRTGLKRAYHITCVNCHKSMGAGPTGCFDCHPKLNADNAAPNAEPKKN